MCIRDRGYKDCSICASNSLDEYIVRDLILQGAKVDSFGIGENLITSKSAPVFGGVYKLAAVKEGGTYVPKIKISETAEKITTPHLDVYKRQAYLCSSALPARGPPFGAGETLHPSGCPL